MWHFVEFVAVSNWMPESWGLMGSSRDSESDSALAAHHSAHAYRYPPKSGHSFFAAHFIMGGEKFDSPQPESFLFGDNLDLNYLGGKPVSFPYPPPAANEPTKALKSQMNVRKDSVHFVVIKDVEEGGSRQCTDNADGREKPIQKCYRPQFTFDSDVRCAVTMYFFAMEEIHPTGISYHSKRKELTSKTYEYGRGANQVFTHPEIVFNPSECVSELNTFNISDDPDAVCAAIHIVSLEGDVPRQTHVTLCSIERYTDDAFSLKAVKQKIFVDGLTYLLQEIYGLENKVSDATGSSSHHSYSDLDDVDDDCGAECVVCMCDLRDTIILPCRHLCLCNACADSLRYQASNCPICRAPFRALLQLRAVQKVAQVTHPAIPEPEPSQEGVPPGYQCVSLMEALNGPLSVAPSQPPPICSLATLTQAAAGAEDPYHTSGATPSTQPMTATSAAASSASSSSQHTGGRSRKSKSSKSSSRSSASSSRRHREGGGEASAATGVDRALSKQPSLAEGDENGKEVDEAGKDHALPSSPHLRKDNSQTSIKFVNELEEPSGLRSSCDILVAASNVGAGAAAGSRITIDLVDEELAKLDISSRTKASSKEQLSESNSDNCPKSASSAYRESLAERKSSSTEVEPHEGATVKDLEADGDDVLVEDEETAAATAVLEGELADVEPHDGEDDEAMVVNLATSGTATRISLPGTPTSFASFRSASVSAVSHQDSASSSCASSAASTRQLLPQSSNRSAVIVRVHPMSGTRSSAELVADEEDC